jgi:hypothetical protein
MQQEVSSKPEILKDAYPCGNAWNLVAAGFSLRSLRNLKVAAATCTISER